MKGREDILVQIGNLSRKPYHVLKVIHDDILKTQLKVEELKPKKEPKKEKKKKVVSEDEIYVIIGKERDIPYRFAKCCSPTPNDRKIV
jgi:(p)ppGpp synthase/HD superfamily hydrolase